MLVALILFVASLINPNPGGLGAPRASSTEPHGVLKITSHPGFVAFTIFGLAHMLMNGWAGDVLFFGTFPSLGILGGMHQDARKIRDLGERYRGVKAKTSFLPFAALISERARWTRAEMPGASMCVCTV